VAINKARVTDFSDASSGIISIGSVVDLVPASSGKQVTYAILGAWDSDPDGNVVSYQTPLGKALLGKQRGDEVTVEIDDHEERWTVKDISRWVDRN
jgi:transcription elongation GreA/GreB family factor